MQACKSSLRLHCVALRCAADLTIDESRNKTCDARWRTGTDGRVRRKNQKRNGSQSSFEKRARKGQKNCNGRKSQLTCRRLSSQHDLRVRDLLLAQARRRSKSGRVKQFDPAVDGDQCSSEGKSASSSPTEIVLGVGQI